MLDCCKTEVQCSAEGIGCGTNIASANSGHTRPDPSPSALLESTASRSPSPPQPGTRKRATRRSDTGSLPATSQPRFATRTPSFREMKSCEGGSTGSPEKRLTARSKVPHHALTGVDHPRYRARRAASTSAACVAEHEVLGHLGRVVGGVLFILVQWRRPRGLLWCGVERYGADEVTDRSQHLQRHCADRSVRRKGDVVRPTIAVLRHGVMMIQSAADRLRRSLQERATATRPGRARSGATRRVAAAALVAPTLRRACRAPECVRARCRTWRSMPQRGARAILSTLRALYEDPLTRDEARPSLRCRTVDTYRKGRIQSCSVHGCVEMTHRNAVVDSELTLTSISYKVCHVRRYPGRHRSLPETAGAAPLLDTPRPRRTHGTPTRLSGLRR